MPQLSTQPDFNPTHCRGSTPCRYIDEGCLISSIETRLRKLESKMGLWAADIERCRQAAEFWASLDERPWTETEILAEEEAIAHRGGVMSHEEALRDLDGFAEIDQLIDSLVRDGT
jgi:hypothetical protein